MGLAADQIGLMVWLDGRIVPSEEAMVSVFDHSFNYGDAVFEGIKFLSGRVFDLEPHLERLYRSAGYLMIDIPMDLDAFRTCLLKTVRANGLEDGYIRVVVSRGTGPLGLRNMDKIETPTIAIICQREKAKSPEDLVAAPGKRAVTVSTRRTPPVCLDPRIKSCNYLNNIIADLERRAAGADFAVMLDIDGYVCEGPAENIFIVKGDRLITPKAAKCLDGITRRSIMAVADSLGFSAQERDFTLYDVYDADEMFSTGSLNDITWIAEVNGRQIGGGTAGSAVRALLPEVRRVGFKNATPIHG